MYIYKGPTIAGLFFNHPVTSLPRQREISAQGPSESGGVQGQSNKFGQTTTVKNILYYGPEHNTVSIIKKNIYCQLNK